MFFIAHKSWVPRLNYKMNWNTGKNFVIIIFQNYVEGDIKKYA